MDFITRTETTGERPIILTRGGSVITCPFATKIPLMEGTLTKQLRIEAQPCWELCPHFSIEKQQSDEYLTIHISCGGIGNIIQAHIVKSQDKSQLISHT